MRPGSICFIPVLEYVKNVRLSARGNLNSSTDGGSIDRREHHLIVPVHVRLAHAGIVARDQFAEESSVEDADCCLQLWSPSPLLTCTKLRST